jgi:hypothetical protein
LHERGALSVDVVNMVTGARLLPYLHYDDVSEKVRIKRVVRRQTLNGPRMFMERESRNIRGRKHGDARFFVGGWHVFSE